MGDYRCVEGSAMETICAPIATDTKILNEVKEQFPFVDKFIEDNQQKGAVGDDIHMLIGADYYWSFIEGDPIRLNEQLVMLRSEFGFILSGLVQRNNATSEEEISPSVLTTNVMLGQVD